MMALLKSLLDQPIVCSVYHFYNLGKDMIIVRIHALKGFLVYVSAQIRELQPDLRFAGFCF